MKSNIKGDINKEPQIITQTITKIEAPVIDDKKIQEIVKSQF